MSANSIVDQQEWRPIPSCPGYEAGSDGRIRSRKGGRLHVLSLQEDRSSHGRLRFQNWQVGGYRWRNVHTVVAEAFYGPRPEGLEVRHLDGNHLNNAVSNLKYGTRSENVQDRVRHGTHHNAIKTECNNGHSFDEANTRWDGTHRQCRACARDRARRNREQVAA